MFPLKRKVVRGYRQGQPTFYSNWHIGTDWAADYEPLYAPFDGEIVRTIPEQDAPDGGNTLWFRPDHDKTLHRYLHLTEFRIKSGHVKMGVVMAITGNTGTSTTPHTHNDISKNGVLQLSNQANFIDPEKYNWNLSLKEDTMLRTYNGTIYALVAGYWMAIGTSYQEYLVDFGNQAAPPMTEAQFKAFPLHKRTIK